MEGWWFSAKDMMPMIKTVESQVRNKGCLKGAILVHMLLDNELVELEHWFHLAMCPKCMKLYDEMLSGGVRDAIRQRLSEINKGQPEKPPVASSESMLPIDVVDDKKLSDEVTIVPPSPFWLIVAPSGISFKFNDPEALFGWKKKLDTYESLQIARKGEPLHVDFSEFIAKFEVSGNAEQSFAECEAVKPFVEREEK